MGEKTIIKKRSGMDTNKTSVSEYSAAMIFGIISPQIRSAMVRSTALTLWASAGCSGNRASANTVAVEEAAMFTKLLPTRMVDSV